MGGGWEESDGVDSKEKSRRSCSNQQQQELKVQPSVQPLQRAPLSRKKIK